MYKLNLLIYKKNWWFLKMYVCHISCILDIVLDVKCIFWLCLFVEELQGQLDYYLSTRLPVKVKLLRLPYRQGLIRARLHGAKNATGDVLVFLDAHCEVIKDWYF